MDTAAAMVSSGLSAVGYEYVNSDGEKIGRAPLVFWHAKADVALLVGS
jgi:hypothetical protein